MDDSGFFKAHEAYGDVMVGLKVNKEKLCAWTPQETHDFLVIRAQLDPDFMETKRNKPLWETVSARMTEIGYNRSSQQCKYKWKNLITRHKVCEKMEREEMRQKAFPFYNDMDAIFNERMHRMLWITAEDGGSDDGGDGNGNVGATSLQIQDDSHSVVQLSSNHDDQEEEEENDGNTQEIATPAAAASAGGGGQSTKRKMTAAENNKNENPVVNGLKEIMEGFMKHQMEMEMEWMRASEEREEKRRAREREWRERMEALERERVMMMKYWREREEQRKMREEARAERKDVLITALLNKFRGEGGI